VTSPRFRMADPIADRQALLDINIEYVSWVFAEIEKSFSVPARDILGMEVADYVPTVIDKVCGDPPPRGVFYLMGGLRWSEDGVAELKRVYVRPSGRGRALGEAVVRRLLADARSFGYRTVRLDTTPFMKSAQALYESLGFVDCAPYPVEMPPAFQGQLRFMELTL
jgi:ribosomal protein S18 acetylase RimI-like enzyme